MQTSVPLKPGKYSAGKCQTYRDRVLDLMPLEDIPFGHGLARSQDTNRAARMPNMNKYVGELDADLVAGDVVTFVGKTVKPDGTETAVNISVTFATDHATTAAAIETAIEADDSDITVTRTNSNRTFTLTLAKDKRLVVTTPLTVDNTGAGTAAFTNTKSTTDSVAAVAERDPNAAALFALTYTEPKHEAKKKMMAGVRVGDPAVPVAGTPKAGDKVYCLLEDYTDTDSALNKRGTFRPNTDGDAAPVVLVDDAEFADTKDSALAPVALNKA